MGDERADLLQGTLEMLVLRLLEVAPEHGWGLTQRLEQTSRGTLVVPPGSLYPALERMTRRAWIRSEWRTTPNNRRARYYLITATGRRRLAAERAEWERASRAVNWILNWAESAG
jgi:transcriptional regulator